MNIGISNIMKKVAACIALGYQSFIAISARMKADTFSAKKQVRNALQTLRKEGAIKWNGKKWIYLSGMGDSNPATIKTIGI